MKKEEFKKKNKVSIIMGVLAIVMFIGYFIFGMVEMVNTKEVINMLIAWIHGTIYSVIVLFFAELLNVLYEISIKLGKK